MANLIISGFKKEFKLSDSECLVDINDNISIDKFLNKYYRCYVISNKMQNQVLKRNYTIF